MPTATPIEEIVAAWRQGATLEDIADAAGVSRQRISQRLIEAGYSPAERRARKIAARTEGEDAYRTQRAQTLAVRAEERDAAVERFLAICREFNVSPQTLGQYTSRTGMYARDVKVEPFRYRSESDRQLGRGKLPGRGTVNGRVVAKRAKQAAAPWSAKHISNLAARRAWRTA